MWPQHMICLPWEPWSAWGQEPGQVTQGPLNLVSSKTAKGKALLNLNAWREQQHCSEISQGRCLLRKLSNHEWKAEKSLDKNKWNYKRKSINIGKKNKFWVVFYVSYCAKCFHWLYPSILEIIHVKCSVQVLVHGRVLQDSSGHYYYYD